MGLEHLFIPAAATSAAQSLLSIHRVRATSADVHAAFPVWLVPGGVVEVIFKPAHDGAHDKFVR